MFHRLVRPRMRGESFRKWTSRNMDKSPLATMIDIFQVVLGFGVTMIYFYDNWSKFQDIVEPSFLQQIQLVIGVLFTVDYVAHFYAADSRLAFFLSTNSLIDLATIAPQWFELAITEDHELKAQANALKTFRALRFLRAFRLLMFTKSAKGRQAAILVLTVLSIIICLGCVIQAIEDCPYEGAPRCQTMEIYRACYFVVITIATLGYGDIAPKTTNGKIAVIFMIFTTGILLPLQISRLSDILNRETEFDKSFKSVKEQNPHVLICGEVNANALDFFLRQFFHPKNTNWKDKVVVLCPTLPSHDMRRILLNSAYEQRVVYLQGSAMLDSDLKRAGASNARLCFIMLNKLAPDGDRNDTSSNFLTISLRHHTSNVPVIVQVLKSDNIHHIHVSGATNIVCIDELKFGILAKSCVVPGFCAFLCNILYSFQPIYTRENIWAKEFLTGCGHDVYEVKLPEYLDGLITFSELALIAYQEIHGLAIATSRRHNTDMRLFPSRTILHSFHRVFLLAIDPLAIREIETISLSTLQKYKGHLKLYERIEVAWEANSIAGKIRSIRSSNLIQRLRQSLISSISPRIPEPNQPTSEPDPDGLAAKEANRRSRVQPSAMHLVTETRREKREPEKPINQPDAKYPIENETRSVPLETESSVDGPLAPFDDASSNKESSTDARSEGPTSQFDSNSSTKGPYVPSRGLESLLEESTLPQLVNAPEEDQPIETISLGPSQGAKELYQKLKLAKATSKMHVEDLSLSRAQSVDTYLSPRRRKDTLVAFLDEGVPKNLKGHIVLCGMPHNLSDFISPLRAKKESSLIPIVVVSLTPLTEKQHAGIADYDKVYYIYGSALEECILREACILTARNIVILTTCMRVTDSYDEDLDDSTNALDDNMIDTDAITLYRYVTETCESRCKKETPLPSILVALNRPSSLRFLKDEMVRGESKQSKRIVKALTRQVLSRADDPLDNFCHPMYASGHVFFLNSLDAVLGLCNRYGSIVDLFALLTFGELGHQDSPRTVSQISIPNEFWHHPYGECFTKMLTTQDTLCLGLYRARPHHHSYVYVNPTEDVVIQPLDKLFILR